ncbi:zinc-binding metallopeptidase [Anaeromicropila herbilytica]|uniref:Uncharacterized protein n=1 Tax=Anaeromicropila herbilytica TaxID=2785025 RepID=A0A7R7ICG9_9FIRM|nr:hypothetical protein [Anaeromicropila herbilytica]BCN30723.1 hypothetical protein bsdtb5_20180 [Anaeromicropila herbilytica]
MKNNNTVMSKLIRSSFLFSLGMILSIVCLVKPVNAETISTSKSDYSHSIQLTVVNSLEERLSKVLGVLDAKLTSDEKAKSLDYLTRLSNLENNRTTYVQTQEEISLIQDFNTYLNELTIKYFPKAESYAKELEDAFGPVTLSKNNEVIENIKSKISNLDYTKINSIYSQYVDNTIESDAAARQIYSILQKYSNKIESDEVLYNIFTVEYGTKARFTIKDDYTVKYQDPARTGLSNLSKADQAKYKRVWAQVRQILPTKYLGAFAEFDISSDGKYGVAAFVEQLDNDGRYWRISVDPADMSNKNEFYHTVIHEFGHYVSLNNTQVKYIKKDEIINPSKDDYYDTSLIANKNSYLNRYYNTFWKEYAFDRNANTLNQLFFCRHYDEFVSEYAATSVAEDFSESFSYYVLPPKNATLKQKERINFFDQFPELVQLKKSILSNMKKNKLIK